MHISKKLLCHSVTVYNITGRDSARNPTYDEGVTVSNVWVNMTIGNADGGYGKESADSMTLYFDTSVSMPNDFVLKKGQKLVFDSNEFTIGTIKPCYGLNGLEHYEAELK